VESGPDTDVEGEGGNDVVDPGKDSVVDTAKLVDV
jgi:hypothetical protein